VILANKHNLSPHPNPLPQHRKRGRRSRVGGEGTNCGNADPGRHQQGQRSRSSCRRCRPGLPSDAPLGLYQEEAASCRFTNVQSPVVPLRGTTGDENGPSFVPLGKGIEALRKLRRTFCGRGSGREPPRRHATAVATRPLSPRDRCRHATAVATPPPPVTKGEFFLSFQGHVKVPQVIARRESPG
jgi:hypothetical protein